MSIRRRAFPQAPLLPPDRANADDRHTGPDRTYAPHHSGGRTPPAGGKDTEETAAMSPTAGHLDAEPEPPASDTAAP